MASLRQSRKRKAANKSFEADGYAAAQLKR